MATVVGKIIATITAIYMLVSMAMSQGTITYTVDRIEEGQNGEQWAVVEVYNSLTDEIHMVDILMEEGYSVQQ